MNFAHLGQNWRAPVRAVARASEFSKSIDLHLSNALSPMSVAVLDRSIRKIVHLHENTPISDAQQPFDWRISK